MSCPDCKAPLRCGPCHDAKTTADQMRRDVKGLGCARCGRHPAEYQVPVVTRITTPPHFGYSFDLLCEDCP